MSHVRMHYCDGLSTHCIRYPEFDNGIDDLGTEGDVWFEARTLLHHRSMGGRRLPEADSVAGQLSNMLNRDSQPLIMKSWLLIKYRQVCRY